MFPQIDSKLKEVFLSDGEFAGMLDLGPEDDLLSSGISSVKFVKLILAIEDKFGFEFGNDDLDIRQYKKFKDLLNVIQRNLENHRICSS